MLTTIPTGGEPITKAETELVDSAMAAIATWRAQHADHPSERLFDDAGEPHHVRLLERLRGGALGSCGPYARLRIAVLHSEDVHEFEDFTLMAFAMAWVFASDVEGFVFEQDGFVVTWERIAETERRLRFSFPCGLSFAVAATATLSTKGVVKRWKYAMTEVRRDGRDYDGLRAKTVTSEWTSMHYLASDEVLRDLSTIFGMSRAVSEALIHRSHSFRHLVDAATTTAACFIDDAHGLPYADSTIVVPKP